MIEKRGWISGATERSGGAQRLDALTARTHYATDNEGVLKFLLIA